MVAFLTRMPAGIPGDVTRGHANAVIEPQIITPSGTTGAPPAYGLGMVVDNTSGNVGNMRVAGTQAGDTAIYGILARPFPTTDGATSTSAPIGTSVPPASGPCNILKSGYCNVLLAGATAAAKGGQVYVWIGAAGSGHVVGGIEAAANGGNTVTYTGAYFTGPADANGNVEIAVNP